MKNELNLKTMTNLKLWKHIVFSIIGLVGLIVLNLIISLILRLYASNVYPNAAEYKQFLTSSTASMILNGASYLILFVIFIILSAGDSDEFFKSFKGWKPYVASLVGFAAILSFNVMYNSFLSIAGAKISDNANESALNAVVKSFPIASLLIFGIIGPICEELTYRVGLFTLLSKVHVALAYVVTIIVFTLIHFDFEAFGTDAIINELLNIPFYAFAGTTFCFLYHKFGFASSVAAHVTNNVFSLLATIASNLQ